MTRLLALDVGSVRIGVAISDATGFLASPYTTLRVAHDEMETFAAIQQLISELEAEGIVVGLPISLDGQIHTQGERIQAFAERLKQHITIPLILWDERLSTVEAQRLLARREQDEYDTRQRHSGRRRSQGKRRQKGHAIDALAAAVFLQDYLDAQGSKTKEGLL